MKKAGGGPIVLMSSDRRFAWGGGAAAYSATRGACRLLAKSGGAGAFRRPTSAAFGASRHHSPRRLGQDPDPKKGSDVNRRNAPIDPRELAAAACLLTRRRRGAGLANGVLFLCTEAANYMTGRQELVIAAALLAADGAATAIEASRRETRLPGDLLN